jgi:GNAT superfamily N-acetyltransferase
LFQVPQEENTNMGIIEIHVDPGLRRQGVGTEFLRAMLREVRALGRTRVFGANVLEGSDADISAHAYAAAGQLARCHSALDREQAALAKIGPDTPAAAWWYFYDNSFYWGTESECALRLGMPVDASDAAGRALHMVAPANLHNSALTLAFKAAGPGAAG